MKNPISDFLEVDLARLNLFGWMLMLGAFAMVVWGIVLIADAEGGSTRRYAFLCWLAAAVLFLGGRAGLLALGVDIYRAKPKEPGKQMNEPGAE